MIAIFCGKNLTLGDEFDKYFRNKPKVERIYDILKEISTDHTSGYGTQAWLIKKEFENAIVKLSSMSWTTKTSKIFNEAKAKGKICEALDDMVETLIETTTGERRMAQVHQYRSAYNGKVIVFDKETMKRLWTKNLESRGFIYSLGKDKMAYFFSERRMWNEDMHNILELKDGEETTIGSWEPSGDNNEKSTFSFKPNVSFDVKRKALAGLFETDENTVMAYLL